MSTPSPALGNRTPEQLRVTELREELRKRGVNIKGLKKDLVDRLEDVLKQEELEQQNDLASTVDDAAAAAPPTDDDQPDPVTPVTKKRSKGHDHNAKEEAKEELEREDALAAVVNDAGAASMDDDQPDPVTPVSKRRSKGHAKNAKGEAKDNVVSEPDDAVVASTGTEVTIAVPAQEGDTVSQSVADESVPLETAAATPMGSDPLTSSAAAVGEVVVSSVPAGEEAPVLESAKAVDEQSKGPSPAENEKVTASEPALEDLVADLERLEDPNFSKVVQEEPEIQEAGKQEIGTTEEQTLPEKFTDMVPIVDRGVDETMGETEEVITTTSEKTVTTTVEEQVVSVVSEDQNVTTVQEEQVVTTSTKVETMEESATAVATTEETTTTVATMEKTITMVADGEGGVLDTGTVRELEEKADDTMGEVPKEFVTRSADEKAVVEEPATGAVAESKDRSDDTMGDALKVVATEVADEEAVAKKPKDEPSMDVDAATEKESLVVLPKDETSMNVDAGVEKVSLVVTPKEETPMDVDGDTEKGSLVVTHKEETPMDVDADAQKGSKRKDAVDGELITLEPTKRRRWNSSKGEGDSRGPAKDAQPLELQEPSSNAPAPSAKVLTPKSAPPEKVAVTRTAPARTEATVNGESQKTRVVPPSAKPATSSLKIDKFLRPFTFKAVKELLAQTGAVQDVWMDQIKTHCFVTYSSVEEATATRNALFNLQWPPQGGRLLTAEFVDPSEVKLRSDGEKSAAAAGSTGATAATAASTNAITPRGAISGFSKALKDGSTAPSSSQPSNSAAALLPPPPPLPLPPRDRPKQEAERTPTLDDLFRKTRSKPNIYYLPLTAKEVAEKLAARNREAATKPGVKA